MFPYLQTELTKDSQITLQIMLILGVGILAWSNSFGAPFVFDDLTVIVNNPQIRNLYGFLTDPSYFSASPRRFLGYLSFAINYRVNGLHPLGYHAVNLALHLSAAMLLFALCRIIMCRHQENNQNSQTPTFSAPLAAALLFTVHPVQTQAVTYITQRFTLLATCFYILTLLGYAKARAAQEAGRPRCNGWYAVSICAAGCAMFSKEIAFSVPLAVLLLELVIFAGTVRQRVTALAPFAAMLLIPFCTVGAAAEPELRVAQTLAATGLPSQAHADYVITQAAVFGTYLRLLLLPVKQTLDYNYPHYHSLAAPPVIIGILIITSLLGLSLYLYRRKTRTARLAVFGICWFIAALTVEAVTPLSDVINEHRLYLPTAGAAMTVASVLVLLSKRFAAKPVNMFLMLMVLVLGATTWKRNLVWSDELLLWSDAAAKAPGKARPHYNLGTILSKRGFPEAARQEFMAALAIEPGHARARYNLGVVNGGKGDLEKARRDYQEAIRLAPLLAEAHNSLGVLLSQEGRLDEAMKSYREALRINPAFADARNNLGAALAAKGKLDAALQEFREAVRSDPQNRPYRENLERALEIKHSP
ncbi:tetratricopeptide repeat protein [Geobacter pelophilus]|uniref:Tetratricopeptide repeat protein n=1 Tax=Geoanaerobacter pelophilus TaxID=60036 RepID=A0AAW4L4X7_9BACT|nr:tetratricopeptide repeat protein [Geoanaerobacter pelophilus]MBT0666274.1 tetratricopeptide repeat protein [Geoanaerobacter pelophilus]